MHVSCLKWDLYLRAQHILKKKLPLILDMIRLFRRRFCSEPGPVLDRSKCLDEQFCSDPSLWIGKSWTTSSPRTRTGQSLVPILVRYKHFVSVQDSLEFYRKRRSTSAAADIFPALFFSVILGVHI